MSALVMSEGVHWRLGETRCLESRCALRSLLACCTARCKSGHVSSGCLTAALASPSIKSNDKKILAPKSERSVSTLNRHLDCCKFLTGPFGLPWYAYVVATSRCVLGRRSARMSRGLTPVSVVIAVNCSSVLCVAPVAVSSSF
jgi:hypothetical protein